MDSDYRVLRLREDSRILKIFSPLLHTPYTLISSPDCKFKFEINNFSRQNKNQNALKKFFQKHIFQIKIYETS